MLCDVGGNIGILNTDCSISAKLQQQKKEKNLFISFLLLILYLCKGSHLTAACLTLTSYTYSSPLLLAITQTAAVINGLWHRC